MTAIRKKIVSDEHSKPVAVLIDYADWIKIEKLLNLATQSTPSKKLDRFAGTIQLNVEPMEFQKKIRSEWP